MEVYIIRIWRQGNWKTADVFDNRDAAIKCYQRWTEGPRKYAGRLIRVMDTEEVLSTVTNPFEEEPSNV